MYQWMVSMQPVKTPRTAKPRAKPKPKQMAMSKAGQERKRAPKACRIELDSKLSPTPKVIPHSYKNPKYRIEMCDQIQDYYRDGFAHVEVCAKLGIHKDTFYEWRKRYPEFAEAVKAGEVLSESWWIAISRSAVRGDIKGDSKMWFANMKNRFHWRDNPADPVDTGLTSVVKDLAALVAMQKSKEKDY
jgi:hypothetical protein